MSNPFSKTGILGEFWSGIKGLFVKAEEEFLPEVIVITQDINAALQNQSVDDLIDAISPKMAGIPGALLTGAQVLVPKILTAELGLEALQSGATPQAAAAWAQSAITAFAGISSNVTAVSKVWTNLAASLAVLFDNGKTANQPWTFWTNLAATALTKIQTAVAAAKAAIVVPAATPAPVAATTTSAS
jgi:hypothetical protein